MSKARLIHRILKGFAGLVLAGILGVSVFLGSLWLEHAREISLPRPTGPFAVGRTLYDWVDGATADTLSPAAGARREVLVWIWYPAVVAQPADPEKYLSTSLRVAVERARGRFISKFLTRDLSKVRGHSVLDADLSPQEKAYPVVIMRGGAALEVWNYSTLAEDLASHGYVVVGVDAPYLSSVVVFPDGRVVRRTPENNPELCLAKTGAEQARCIARLLAAWTGDIAFVLDRLAELNASDALGKFEGRIDMERVGILGHSFGGAQAAQFCHEDARCRAGIDIDGAPVGSVVQEGMHQPFIFLMSDHRRESDPRSTQILADIQSIYDRLPENGRQRIVIRGANHFTFSDDGALLKSQVTRGLLRLFRKLGIDGRRQLTVTSYCVRTFFDAYLKGPNVSPPRMTSPLYPEIEVIE